MADTTINGLRVPDEYKLKIPIKPYTGQLAGNESGDLMGNSTHNSIDLKIGDVYVSSLGLTLAAKQTGTFTCKPGFIYPVDTTTNEVIGIIPANWPLGARVTFIDVSGMWDTNKFILRSTIKIKGDIEDKEYTGKYQSESLIYPDSQRGIIPFGGGSSNDGKDGGSGSGSSEKFKKLTEDTDLVIGGRYFSKSTITCKLPDTGEPGDSLYYINHADGGSITGPLVSPYGAISPSIPLGPLKDYTIQFIWDDDVNRWHYIVSSTNFDNASKVILYDDPGTFTYKPPFGLKALLFIMVGGGGAGGTSRSLSSGYYPSTGGGAGAYSAKVVSEILEEYTIVVGKGGTKGTINGYGNPTSNGTDGGTSSVSNVATAGGGRHGNYGSRSPTSTRGVAGGIATGGDININGRSSSGTSDPYNNHPSGVAAPDVDANLPETIGGVVATLVKNTTPVSKGGSGGRDAGKPGYYGGSGSGASGQSFGNPGGPGGDGYVIVVEM